ncbi:MAG: cache domain-containing protein [Candidatus Alcyoniella australis]|nr:cache domain-containing protein [Candidatus Alcyoniella australis]
MKNIALWVLLLTLAAASVLAAQDKLVAPTNPDELVVFVNQAAAFANLEGKDAALVVFNDKNGKFTVGDVYVFAYNFDGMCLAHALRPERVGTNTLADKDVNGVPFIKNLLETARDKGQGFDEYSYVNPNNGQLAQKTSYVIKIDDTWWIGAGIYKK